MYNENIDEETGKPYGWCNYWNEDECMEWEEVEEFSEITERNTGGFGSTGK